MIIVSTGDLMHKFCLYWEAIDQADGKDLTWKRYVRTDVLTGLLRDCVACDILDATRSESPAEDNIGYELMISSV